MDTLDLLRGEREREKTFPLEKCLALFKNDFMHGWFWTLCVCPRDLSVPQSRGFTVERFTTPDLLPAKPVSLSTRKKIEIYVEWRLKRGPIPGRGEREAFSYFFQDFSSLSILEKKNPFLHLCLEFPSWGNFCVPSKSPPS